MSEGLRKRAVFVVAAAVGILFLMIFSYTTSPLFPYQYGWDSAFFQLVGEGMTKDKIPYRDFFDMKGPWLFFIQYIGQKLFYGRFGCFFMQCISMVSSIFIIHKTINKLFDRKKLYAEVITLFCYFFLLISTLEGGNLTEEFSMPFLLLAVYLSIDFVKGKEEKIYRNLYIYGFIFGIIALIRITNAILICAVTGTVLITLLVEKNFRKAIVCVLWFILGTISAFVLPVLYFGKYGQLKEMLNATFVFGFQYATESFQFDAGVLYLLLLLLPVCLWILAGVKNKRAWMALLLYVTGTFAVVGMGSPNLHDYMLFIPGALLGIWGIMCNNNEKRYTRYAVILVVLVCAAYPGYKSVRTVQTIVQLEGKQDYDMAMEIGSQIPDEDRESVYGYDIPMRWYTINDIMPCNKYCGWQEHYIKLSLEIGAEIQLMFEENPPEWVVTESDVQPEDIFIGKFLRQTYEMAGKNQLYALYKLK